MNSRLHRFAGFAALAFAGAVLTSPAVADGMRGSMKDAPKETPRCTFSANVALATEYVFRGVSQTAEGPAIQGGFDATCGLFYAGVWASNLDWGSLPGSSDDIANIEIDWYAGIKPKTGRITWDLGVIYYSYPNSMDSTGFDNNYFEIKVGGSAEVWKDGTLGVTVFYSPEYQYETGAVWTVETSFSQVLPKIGRFSPTFSALVGYQAGDDAGYASRVGNGEDHYWYWNAGVTIGFAEKWSLDLRYWDTDLDKGTSSTFCRGQTFQCDERFVGTLKFTY
jgi:uncharacterized protein (TIGR02001 family)